MLDPLLPQINPVKHGKVSQQGKKLPRASSSPAMQNSALPRSSLGVGAGGRMISPTPLDQIHESDLESAPSSPVKHSKSSYANKDATGTPMEQVPEVGAATREPGSAATPFSSFKSSKSPSPVQPISGSFSLGMSSIAPPRFAGLSIVVGVAPPVPSSSSSSFSSSGVPSVRSSSVPLPSTLSPVPDWGVSDVALPPTLSSFASLSALIVLDEKSDPRDAAPGAGEDASKPSRKGAVRGGGGGAGAGAGGGATTTDRGRGLL